MVDYEHYLLARIHRGDDLLLRPNTACVTLEFDYSNRGVRENYVVERSWERKGENGGLAHERLSVLRNQAPLNDVEAEFWPDFIQGLVPPAVGNLFFFDAERIRDLAEDDTDAEMLAQAVKSLLGLDHVERLVTDLDIYAARAAKAGTGKALGRAISDAEQRIDTVQNQLRRLREERAHEQTLLDHAVAQVERTERELAQQGHGFAKQRSDAKTQKASLDSSLTLIESELRQLCESVLPVALCPKIAEALEAQLLCERDARRWEAVKAQAKSLKNRVRKRLATPSLWRGVPLDRDTIGVIRQRVLDALYEEMGEPATYHGLQRHGLAERDEDKILSWLEAARGTVRKQVLDLATRLDRTELETQALLKKMGQAPADDAIQPLVARLRDLASGQGELQQALKAKDDKLAELEREIETGRRTLARLAESAKSSDAMRTRLVLVSKLSKASREYGRELTEAKLAELERSIATSFNDLCRKTEEIRGVHIDRQTFKVTLVDRHARLVPKQDLSEGEKQIYAVSVLNALARTSGRHIPVIVDTPLGRLDSGHRDLLVNRYFPTASHQVVLLSTDTEVDLDCCRKLSSYVSHAFTVTYHPEGSWSEVKAGYFWNMGGGDARATG
jgi:DNA sulfur modification protein DndD